jgi:hypothetical protein
MWCTFRGVPTKKIRKLAMLLLATVKIKIVEIGVAVNGTTLIPTSMEAGKLVQSLN